MLLLLLLLLLLARHGYSRRRMLRPLLDMEVVLSDLRLLGRRLGMLLMWLCLVVVVVVVVVVVGSNLVKRGPADRQHRERWQWRSRHD